MSISNPFGLTKEAIRLINEGNEASGGFKIGHWTNRAAQQLAVHEGPLTTKMAKAIAKEHNTTPRLLHIAKRKLVVLGLWDEAKGGLGVNSVKLKVKRKETIDQNDESDVPDVPNGEGQSGGKSKETSFDVPNVPNGNDQIDLSVRPNGWGPMDRVHR